MNTANTQAQQRIAEAAIAQADEISLKLCNLTEIVKLAAFAAEARRTLEEIKNVMHYRPEMQKVIKDGVLNASNWSELEDNTGDVLGYVARQLEKVNDDFTQNLYGLAHAKTGSIESEKIGGAA